jgi:cytidylate kinase
MNTISAVQDRRLVIAIDGPAASGKSSTAQWVARRLGVSHLDSGALYRAATAARYRELPDPTHWKEGDVLRAAARVGLSRADPSFVPLIDGVDASAELRSIEVTRHVSQVAQMPGVRLWVRDQVRQVAREHDVVVDGRDMGTAVFPDAPLKIFLIADPWERARRRLIQRSGSSGGTLSDEEIAAEAERLVHRDALDATQSAPARDAILIDTTMLTQQEQVDRIVALAHALNQRGDVTSRG